MHIHPTHTPDPDKLCYILVPILYGLADVSVHVLVPIPDGSADVLVHVLLPILYGSIRRSHDDLCGTHGNVMQAWCGHCGV